VDENKKPFPAAGARLVVRGLKESVDMPSACPVGMVRLRRQALMPRITTHTGVSKKNVNAIFLFISGVIS